MINRDLLNRLKAVETKSKEQSQKVFFFIPDGNGKEPCNLLMESNGKYYFFENEQAIDDFLKKFENPIAIIDFYFEEEYNDLMKKYMEQERG